MPEGFFAQSDIIERRRPLSLVPLCGSCGLFKQCQSPKMALDGEGRKEILVVGEAPGATEDKKGRPFVGDSGQYLKDALSLFGISLRRDCWIYNAIICHPPKNRTPTSNEVDYCRPNVLKIVQKIKPKTIIVLGATPIRSLIGYLWKEDPGGVERWAGWRIPLQRWNCWVCPTWHPSYLLRTDEGRGIDPVLEMFFRRHLEKAVALKRRPWKVVPNYLKQVERLYDPDAAARAIPYFTKSKTPVAFDFENNRLAPYHRDARIVCCSMSDGTRTIAYPWHGKAILATQDFLRSDAPKFASNMKHEETWTWKEFGHGVTNWHRDSVLTSHVLDNRPNTKSIKFQAFVTVGQETWNEKVEPFLKAPHANAKNRIDEVSIEELLLYCGMDSLMEWKVLTKQEKRLTEE